MGAVACVGGVIGDEVREGTGGNGGGKSRKLG